MMKVHVELLLGKRVHDPNGRNAGRILEIMARKDGAHCFVTEYLLGSGGLLTRLGISSAHLVGLPVRSEPKRIPWQQMDLSDPDHPRLRVPIEELP